MKATCECMAKSGATEVVAVQDGPFSFIGRWDSLVGS
jgi:hypothetical protein